MTNYREILRLRWLGLSNSRIVEFVGASRPTVIRTLRAAAEAATTILVVCAPHCG